MERHSASSTFFFEIALVVLALLKAQLERLDERADTLVPLLG
jgi:hypothetical protein